MGDFDRDASVPRTQPAGTVRDMADTIEAQAARIAELEDKVAEYERRLGLWKR